MTSLLFKVFVYGTLKNAQPNYHILSNKENGFSEFLSKGTTSQKYPLVIGKLTINSACWFLIRCFFRHTIQHSVPYWPTRNRQILKSFPFIDLMITFMLSFQAIISKAKFIPSMKKCLRDSTCWKIIRRFTIAKFKKSTLEREKRKFHAGCTSLKPILKSF